jgi:hypothetical protein
MTEGGYSGEEDMDTGVTVKWARRESRSLLPRRGLYC